MNKIRTRIILEILRRENKISPSSFDDGLELIENNQDPIDVMLKNDIISKSDVSMAFNQYYNSPYIDLDNVHIIIWIRFINTI